MEKKEKEILESGLPEDFNLVKLEVLDDDEDEDGLPKDFSKMMTRMLLSVGHDPEQERTQ